VAQVLTFKQASVRPGGPVWISTYSLSQLLFTCYISPISSIASSFDASIQQYADDIQIYIALTTADVTAHLTRLSSCLSVLHNWFCHNGLALNSSKSESILLSYNHQNTTKLLPTTRRFDLYQRPSPSGKTLRTESQSVLPDGSKRPYTSGKKDNRPWTVMRVATNWTTHTTAFLTRRLPVASRIGRTEYQLLLMKASDRGRNVKF